MKKIFLILLILEFSIGTAIADQMIIRLKSGNNIVIDYTGSVEGVAIQGDSEAIVGMQSQSEKKALESLSTTLQPDTKNIVNEAKVEADTSAPEKKASTVRIKWTKPIDDENLKNARSESRVVTWFK
ncbi:MAG: hypothetical protein QM483_12275 [Desulfuromusa sp.]